MYITFPVDHILSELSTMIRQPWVALHSMAHSFIELDKAVVHVISLVSFLWLWFAKRTHWSYQTPSPKNTREDSTHGFQQMVNTKIRLIIFFAAKDALYSQQK